MRALITGARELRRTPIALVPLGLEGVVAAVLVAAGAFPSDGSVAAVGAAFPFDVYWDVKQAVAFAPTWSALGAAVALSILVRGASLGATFWLLEGRNGSIARVWVAATRWSVGAALVFFPVAALMFSGVGLRYAPFVWIAGAIGFVLCVVLARRAYRIDAGAGRTRGTGVPEALAMLVYAYLVSVLAAGLGAASDVSPLLSATVVLLAVPFHASFVAGWRHHLRAETYPGGGAVAGLVTLLFVASLFGAAMFDRYVHDPPPVADARDTAALLLLGGADSTDRTGALTEIDPRDLGFEREATTLLSYRGSGEPYSAMDTRADLRDIAQRVAEQVSEARSQHRRVFLVGHSQAALIVDRMIDDVLALPDRSVVISAPPAEPPSLSTPRPGVDGPGVVGSEAARGLAALWDAVGPKPFDIDAPASPTNLTRVAPEGGPPRLAIWALGDSVWLDRDHRRRGESNITVFTDHVGAVNNASALSQARSFLGGGVPSRLPVLDVAVGALRYAFEPWRP